MLHPEQEALLFICPVQDLGGIRQRALSSIAFDNSKIQIPLVDLHYQVIQSTGLGIQQSKRVLAWHVPRFSLHHWKEKSL